jgi:hypothetical protein
MGVCCPDSPFSNYLSMLGSPILFLIFNRPDTTRRVFEVIRRVKPRKLFIAADGPRPNKEGEMQRCLDTRRVVSEVDWDCEVQTLYREQNLGCGLAVSQAISWFFEHVDQGIILEDDCLPDPSFFTFCSHLLDYYKDEEEVMHISGNNFQNGIRRGEASYYFSRYVHVWGWATWKRAWTKYDFKLCTFENREELRALVRDNQELTYWENAFTAVKRGDIDTWDIQWVHAVWKNEGLAILPNVNLVSNIGFGEYATHTFEENPLVKLKADSIQTVTHPATKTINSEADRYFFRNILSPPPSLWSMVRQFVYRCSIRPRSVIRNLMRQHG